jgi:hypothetical protein
VQKKLTGIYELSAGDQLKLELGGLESLDVVVPDGKDWKVSVYISIKETDSA